MDYAALRRAGIGHLERMAGQLWNDFNVHDPGITILEQVCYALTDLAYRINYELPDLLTSADASASDSLYGPAQILTSHPVTLDDMRRLAIDVEGVKNAWVTPAGAQDLPLYFHAGERALSLQGDDLADEPIRLSGLYRVLIEISDLLYIEGAMEQRAAVLQQVARRLHANRPLGEDFEEIRILDPEDIQIQARIEIEAVEDAEAVLLMIYQRIADYVSPPVRFSSLGELLAAGQRVEDIFEGPLLQHGFISAGALQQAERRTELRASDVIREIMDVPGVRAVRTISLSSGGRPEEWTLSLDASRAPKFNPVSSSISLERNQLAVGLSAARVLDAYYQHLRQSAAAHASAFDQPDLSPPQGRDRHTGSYYSLLHQFPDVYGIGAMGLPASASPQRQAQARQLTAYLMFFDQLLANYFVQLAHVGDLFAFSTPTSQTYFSQPVDDPALGLGDIRRSDLPAHRERLRQIAEDPAATAETPLDARRRQRFLNHLLARFAEQFTDYSLVLYGVMAEAESATPDKLIRDKQLFLQDYPRLSSARGTGHDYMLPWDSANSSGLEQRLYSKLGIANPEERFYIVEHILLRPIAGDLQQPVPILAEPRLRDPYSLQISLVFPDWPARFRNPDFRAFVRRTAREETPAHLALTIRWLDQPAMAAFEAAHGNWLDTLRSYWAGKLEI